MRAQTSVITLTRDRPEMLADALLSIRRQTRVAAIRQVIVSENGSTEASRKVCEEFGELPICYVKQDPPVPALMHVKALWHQVESPIVAFLHDDDWWMPEHMESALNAIEGDPECVATFANFLDSYGPTVVPFHSQKGWRVWVSSGCDFSLPVVALDKVSVLLACLLESTFHYSTVVGQKDAIWEAYLKNVTTENAWDNERTFPVFLSALGRINYVTRPSAYIRNHPTQEGLDPASRGENPSEMRVKTTRWLADREPETTVLAVKRFNDAVRQLRLEYGERPDYVGLLSSQITEPQRTALIKELGLNLIPSTVAKKKAPEKDAKWFAKQLMPPAVLALRRQIKRMVRTDADGE